MWRSLRVPPSELRLHATLMGGQSFRWRRTSHDEWTGVIGRSLVSLRETEHDVQMYIHATKDSNTESLVRDYLQLATPLHPLIQEWTHRDMRLQAAHDAVPGLRVLRQSPFECLVSFICSSNNNIQRITGMVDRLCAQYGEALASVNGHPYHAFPTPKRLEDKVQEEDLRSLGFGYRSKYIVQTLNKMEKNGGEPWLMSLRHRTREEARQELITLPGVGPKVADCVCLYALDKTDAVPVDTHVWQLTCRDYLPSKSGKSLTARTYSEIGDFFRELYGIHAGWAQVILFASELPGLRESLSHADHHRKRNDILVEEERREKSQRRV